MEGWEQGRSEVRAPAGMLAAFLLYLPFVTLGSRLTAWKPS